ncbi:CEI_1a_G0001390.mRNA.1.CDS.1 [Saccharomyces cerevisiae]|nr:EM14S01-3B_G0013320.mRNA.1.CDS.1 [Saccharomyces cerevisiae]CAI4250633.1 AMH_1a_G0001530.mRNA.1.CDS.1 [Saccharomyces cerevisiae]CAI4253237.1 CEI_1a_G0001390.mRNA.1.CDS.1 [Saccharomyces cerevisiae]CAI6479728.1 AMH_1a_G0001530.mRNA.1.CDS.1 [Saccharomyces cerevisiae]CAI7133193.1 CEI_1a_G0001390.mRNA.1.CDS.1 [Saccharomyces cerevisiae]
MSSTMLDDVDNNMMGIKSISLYELLSDVVKQGDKTRLVTAGPEQVLPDLIRHITETIPFDLFINLKNEMNDAENLVTRLNWLGKFLNDNFLHNHTFPFTILRICELCYDPFKYYKINELEKFVNALEKCCMVTSSWQVFDKTYGEKQEDDKEKDISFIKNQEDVSLMKIPWMTENNTRELAPFIREIDSIMSVNLGYDDEDEEDEDNGDGEEEGFFDGDEDREMGNKSKHNVLLKDENFMVEEYYEDDCGINDDNTDNKGQNCQSDVTKNNSDDEDDDDNDDDYREDGADEDDEDDDHMGSTDDDEDDDEDRQTGESTKVQNFDKKNETPRKRKPTDLDNFEYEESPSFTNMDLTTPKKYKHTATGRFSIIESPSSSLLNAMDGSNEISSSQEEEKEYARENHEGGSEGLLPGDELVSPSMSSSQGDKMVAIAGITYRENISSPLGKKSR